MNSDDSKLTSSTLSALWKNPLNLILVVLFFTLSAVQIVIISNGKINTEKIISSLKKNQSESGGMILSTYPPDAEVMEFDQTASNNTIIGKTPILLQKGSITLRFIKPGFHGEKAMPAIDKGMSTNTIMEIKLTEDIPVFSSLFYLYPLSGLSIIPFVLIILSFLKLKKAESDATNALPEITYIGEGGKIGKYRLLSLIGKGSMAEVFSGQNMENKSKENLIAIKILFEDVGKNKEFRSRFDREVRILQELKHSNIVALYDYGEEAGRLYMTIELVEGINLRELIKPGGMDVTKAFSLILPVLEALDFAHNKEIIHRDLKPENILIAANDIPKITDFGLARGAQYETITATESALGTPAYMPPEQITGAKPDGRADLYSLGCILYEMITGSILYPGEHPSSMIIKHLTEPPKTPKEIKPDLSPDIEGIIMKLLEKAPEDRYQTAKEVIDAIQALK